jgi:hypothetical protein
MKSFVFHHGQSIKKVYEWLRKGKKEKKTGIMIAA